MVWWMTVLRAWVRPKGNAISIDVKARIGHGIKGQPLWVFGKHPLKHFSCISILDGRQLSKRIQHVSQHLRKPVHQACVVSNHSFGSGLTLDCLRQSLAAPTTQASTSTLKESMRPEAPRRAPSVSTLMKVCASHPCPQAKRRLIYGQSLPREAPLPSSRAQAPTKRRMTLPSRVSSMGALLAL